MSTTDKARQQLIDSMRKTKTAGSAETPESTKKPAATSAPSSRSKRKVSATKAPKSVPRRGTAITGPGGADPYQASPRVWPD